MRHRYYSINEKGRDYAVGDIHGEFPALEKKLNEIGFDKSKDRLFATGDLVDKGKYSRQAYGALQGEWFKSTLGNHDLHVVKHGEPTKGKWIENYGVWFSRLNPTLQGQLKKAFSELPLAITVETTEGFIGIVHAGTPYDTWLESLSYMDSSEGREKINFFLYNRVNFNNRLNTKPIRDLRALLVGHSPVPNIEVHANTWYLDTNAYDTGNFQILDLQTLEVL